MTSVPILAPTVGGCHMLRLRQWFVPEGERVEQGTHVAELGDDRMMVRVLAPAAGTLMKYISEGCLSAQGACIGTIKPE